MNEVTVVTTSNLTETFLITMLFPFCCQVGTTVRISVFLSYLNLRNFTKKVSETR